ncbi:MAG: hypothetical protein ACI3XR_10165 [Eubacteriales bacterium]
MENNHESDTFRYTYSAKEQKEIQNIRKKYVTKDEDKMERLRRLDRSVTQKARTVSLAVGIVGILILGFGMSLIMSGLSELLGLYRETALPIGIATGGIGGILACLAYPIYNHIVRRERKKIAPEILRLTDELMKES